MSEQEWQEWLDEADPDFVLADIAYQQTGEGFYSLAPSEPSDD